MSSREYIAPTLVRWSYKDRHEGISSHVYIFDLDHTLVKPREGRKFPNSANDWIWWDEKTLKALSQYRQDSIIIITNQAGEDKGVSLDRIDQIVLELIERINPQFLEVYAALAKDAYRKPQTFIVDLHIQPRFPPDLKSITYTGDAAGRPADYSDSDRAFAYNLGILLRHGYGMEKVKVGFRTPETWLDKESDEYGWKVDPIPFFSNLLEGSDALPQLPERGIVVLVGPPGSGKTTLADALKKEYGAYIARITTTRPRMLKEIKEAMGSHSLIVVDAMNSSVDDRRPFLELGLPAHCIILGLERKYCEHLNIYRAKLAFREGGEFKPIAKVVYNTFYKHYQNPRDHLEPWESIEIYHPKFMVTNNYQSALLQQLD